ncbi:MAG: helix-turn-helix domain-containing protein [Caldimonas sp.]
MSAKMFDSEDGRVQRTGRRLHEALADLIYRKSYDRIGVKEILAEAHIARSTFYAHSRGKDELLQQAVSDIVKDGLEQDVLGFSKPLLLHMEAQRLSLLARGHHAQLHRKLQDVIELRIAERLRRGPPFVHPIGLTPELRARHAASTFGTILEWWSVRTDLCAEQVEAEYRRLLEPVFGP